MPVCAGHPAIDLGRMVQQWLISPGPGLLEAGRGAPASEADGRAAQSSEHTVVIGGGRDPGGAGGARRPSNVDRSITAVDHPAIGARIGAQKHGSQIQRPY